MNLKQHRAWLRELSFQQLLNQRVCDMELRPADTLRACLIQLLTELKKRHISYYPHFYFGEEPWGCIDGTSSIEIPFYLANSHLRKVAEKHYMTYTDDEIMVHLRHEVGHAINYAYKIWQMPEWRRLFGNFKKQYREFYNYDATSRDFVRCLHFAGHPHYAQKHPDEDFAETFAIWLDPYSHWKTRYKSWPVALEKLQFVDTIFRKKKIAVRRPLKMRVDESGSYRCLDMTVAEYFGIEKKIDPRVREYTEDLKEIFPELGPRARRATRADMFIQTFSKYLEDEIANWIAGADRRDIRIYLRQLQTICALNNLRLHPDKATERLIELVVVATYHVLHRLKRVK